MTANPEQLKRVRDHRRSDIFFCIALTSAEPRAFLGSSDFHVYEVEDLSAEKPEFQPLGKHDSYVTAIAVAGDVAVSGGYDGRLIWWKTESGEQVRSVDAHEKWVRDIAASPDGKTIASVADDMVCRLWNAESGEMLHELRGHEEKTPHHFPSMLYACTFSPDGKHLATGDKVGHIVIWEVQSGKPVTTLEAPVMYTWDPRQRIHSIGGIRSLAFSPDGNTLAVGGMGKVGNIDHLGGKSRIVAFDWRQGEQTLEFEDDKYKGLVERLIYGPDAKWLLAAGGDHGGFITFLDPKTKKVIRQEKIDGHVHDATFDDDGTLYIAAHGRVEVWSSKG